MCFDFRDKAETRPERPSLVLVLSSKVASQSTFPARAGADALRFGYDSARKV